MQSNTSKMQAEYIDPRLLKKNPWNPNKVDPINQQKLVNSLRDVGVFKPVIVRTLDDDSLEIIGGEHRVDALIELGHEEIMIVNLGKISDRQAKKVLVADNSQYGETDNGLFAKLIGNGDVWDLLEYVDHLPVEEEYLVNIFDHGLDDLESLEMDFGDTDDTINLEPESTPSPRTQILRFKIASEDAHIVTTLINRIKAEQGFTQSDDLTNAGDALVHFCKEMTNE